MLLRRTTPLAIALLALACEPSVPFDTANNPSQVDYAAFDPTGTPPATGPDIPLPNDLALQPQAIATQSGAQQALLKQWAVEGFPNDQEVPITIDFVTEKLDPNTGAATRVPTDLDPTSINSTNLRLLAVSSTGAVSAIAYDPPKAADYAKPAGSDHGILTLHKSPAPASDPNPGTRRWPANSTIVYAVRGGANGVKVNASTSGVQPQAAMYLLTHCCKPGTDLTSQENLGVIPGNTRAEKLATATQLEALRKLYLAPFAAIEAPGGFSRTEIATMGTFKVADTSKRTHVETDPSSGEVPLPSDLLSGANGHLSSDAVAAFNAQQPGLGTGLSTLDGFSTTAMVLAQVSTPIQAATVKDGVFIYEIGTSPPIRRLQEINEALLGGKTPEYVAEPSPIVQSGLSTAIGLQPAVPAPVPGVGLVTLPPFKEGTTYVVVVTDKVKDLNGDPLTRGTLAKLLLLDPTISIASGGKSTVSGVSDAQAVGLDQMRVAINGAAQALAAEKSITRDHIAMAYTFHTQTMKTTAVTLAALPYGTPLTTINPLALPTFYGVCGAGACTNAIATVLDLYGVDATVPTSNIGTIVEATIATFNALDPTTGAFLDLTNPANHPAAEPITALIALPSLATIGCATPPCNIPLVIFHHGIGRGRGDMLTIADTFNAQGIAVAAIDGNKQGDRTFCSANNQCSGTGAVCTPVAAMANQGDPAGATPGHCTGGNNDLLRTSVLCPSGTCSGTKGIPRASSNFIISANFFRSRDSFRQDLIDQSQLIRVLAPDPSNFSPNAIFTETTGLQIDPNNIWYVGQSLGSINGAVDVAANPRIGKAVFSAGGGTIIDVFTNSPSYASAVNALLASLGAPPGSAKFLTLINIAKWILDPADPINFAVNLSKTPLASPVSGNQAPDPRNILSQISNCDTTVPNPFNLELQGLTPAGTNGSSLLQLLTRAASGSGNYASTGQANCAAAGTTEAVAGGGSIPHGIFTNWGVSSAGVDATLHTLTGNVQSDAAAFLKSDAAPSNRDVP